MRISDWSSDVCSSDLDVARLESADPGHRVPHLAFQPDAMDDTPVLPISEIHSSYYLRMRVQDRPGVLADIARILSEVGISIGSMFQQPSGEKQADIIFLTPAAREGAIDPALLDRKNTRLNSHH